MHSRSTRKRCRFCPHCNKILPKSAFYSHKAKYFKLYTGEWMMKKNSLVVRISDSSDRGESYQWLTQCSSSSITYFSDNNDEVVRSYIMQ